MQDQIITAVSALLVPLALPSRTTTCATAAFPTHLCSPRLSAAFSSTRLRAAGRDSFERGRMPRGLRVDARAAHLRGDGAGDVKLFAAVGAVVGLKMVLPTFVVVVLTGGVLAIWTVLRAGTLGYTMHRVLQIFVGLCPVGRCRASHPRRPASDDPLWRRHHARQPDLGGCLPRVRLSARFYFLKSI